MNARLHFQRSHTPIPKRDREIEATRSGPVKTYRLSEEELAASRERARQAIESRDRPRPVKKPVGIALPPISRSLLQRMLEKRSISSIARRMGVTTTMVRKWIEYYRLSAPKPSPSDDIRPGYVVAEADPDEEENP